MRKTVDELYRADLLALLMQIAPQEGYNLTPLDKVRILRSNRPLQRTPVLYEPGIVFVCQGQKRGYFGDKVYLYDAQHYLSVSNPVPFTMESEASDSTPLLAIYIQLDFQLAAEMSLELDGFIDSAHPAKPESMMSSPMDSGMAMALYRFVESLADPLQARILAKDRLREVYFRVLTGPQGDVIRATLSMQGQYAKIGKAIRYLHSHPEEPIEIASLAKRVGMSVPTFHAHFKAITQTTPIQYLKSLRLHKARLLIIREGITAAAASVKVGYESQSQFNREFKRLFGLPPVEESRRMQTSFHIPPARVDDVFVSSH